MSPPPDPLHDLLQTWQHRPVQNPHFNSGVWARLAEEPAKGVQSRSGWAQLLPFFSESWSRGGLSLAASVLIVLSVALGSGAALVYDSFTRDQRMATAYAHTIDPLQMSLRP
jgi:hypothetical protein